MKPSGQPPRECDDTLHETLKTQPGVVGLTIQAEPRRIQVDYLPHAASEAEVGRLIERVAPMADDQFVKCTLRLEGRACEGCAIRLERKAEKIEGVRRAAATFIGGVMTINYNEAVLSESELEDRVRATGAPVSKYEPPTDAAPASGWRSWLQGDRLEITCTVATFVLMITGWVLGRAGLTAASWTTYVLAYLAGGFFGVQAGWQSLKERTIDVDLLMVLAALGAAFVGAPFEGAMLLFLFSLSNVLQAYAIDRTRRAINSLMKLRPTQSLCRRGNETKLLPVEELVVGDILIVRPGESIALDSTVVEGTSTIDESMLTGESLPVSKSAGMPVFAGTINQTGGLEIKVTKLAKDSTIAKLIKMVEEAQSEKAQTQRFLDRAEQYYAIGVLAFTFALIVVPYFFLGHAFHATFYRAMTVMVVASPCALIISTPASILSAIGGAARRGVLFKGGAHLERMAGISVVAFDKTGTLTRGKPRVTHIVTGNTRCEFSSCTNPEAIDLLQLAAAVEAKSEHPLARAIVAAAEERRIPALDASGFQSVSGKGASAVVRGRRIAIGSPGFFEERQSQGLEAALAHAGELQDQGKTCVVVGELDAQGGSAQVLGVLAVADVLRPDAPAVIKRLKQLGVKRVVMLTGDHKRVAHAIAREAGVDEVHAQLLPEEKVRVVRELQNIGPVAMVGDGINDAPALAAAQIGIAMGAAGTDVAMETADVVLMSDNLHNIALALDVSRRARRVVIQNLTFAFGVILVMVTATLAAHVPMPLGVVAHEGSTVLVCLNGLRLLLVRDVAAHA
ncbi:heavy metal translocating P-type ATPase [Opitutus sp. ER46]|uniref:heavy metal translocating P-type ATPase n=1 Tax=Opitutus sp. ER46 TaxID=2161864 RepID=UPI001304BFB8|nr:heavy metal translocating P-type ATPase [Opitutus sp. ER46]